MLSYLKRYERLYLATVYRKYKPDIDAAWKEACRIEAELRRAGLYVYGPIAHCHSVAINGNLDPYDDPFWVEHIRREQNLCDALVVAQMEGWPESDGISGEIAHAVLVGQPIYALDPITLKVTKWGCG